MVTQARPARSSFFRDVLILLRGSGFRKLYTTRLISQTGDGIFTSGLGAYVFFNANSYPDPAAAAISFAVLYLPYSLIGPFAGVFIDRWSRRQILLWSAVLRSLFVVLTALFIDTGALGPPVWLSALVVLGVNRFFLSALSAALPHVVAPEEFVMANSVGPTSGTLVGFIGAGAGLTIHFLTGGGKSGSAITLLAGGLCYLLAGLSATRIERNALGPDRSGGDADQDAPAVRDERLGAQLEGVALGLLAGLRHLWHRPHARAALAATGAHRLLYGVLLLMSILLYRNYFDPASSGNSALGHFVPVIVSSGLGYATAALITPAATRRLTNAGWVALLLASGGVITGTLGPPFGQVEFIAIGFGLGVVAQGIAICTTTILQQEVADEFRGRVFSVNDMLYNVTFVAGAAIGAAFMPRTGHSVILLVLVAVGYLLAAAGYRLLAGQSRSDEPGPGGSAPESGSPASPAQRSNS